jgi:hypothetical protein
MICAGIRMRQPAGTQRKENGDANREAWDETRRDRWDLNELATSVAAHGPYWRIQRVLGQQIVLITQ